jgi:rifampicin phosphotransferase
MSTVPLRDAGPDAGTKAASLGALLRAGLPVPEGVVIAAPAALDDPRLAAALAPLDEALVAVRSSAMAEDLDDASFAGQYRTELGVRGMADILTAAGRCRASANEPMAVLVQRQVDACAAGVAFTADPVTGDRGVTVISAVRGLGDRLVERGERADEWVVRGGEAVCRRDVESAIDAATALEVAALARRTAESSVCGSCKRHRSRRCPSPSPGRPRPAPGRGTSAWASGSPAR